MKAKGEGVVENEMVDNMTDLMDMNLSKLQETVNDREAWVLQSMGLPRVRHNSASKQQLTF